MAQNRTTRSNSLPSANPVTINDIQNLKNDMLTSIKQEFSNLANCIQALESRIGHLENSFDSFRTIQSKQQAEINEIKLSLSNLQLSKSEILDEVEDRERRRNNIVLFGLPESGGETAEERKEKEKESLREVLNALNCRDVEVKSSHRLGKVVDGKPRPIKAVLGAREDGVEVLKKARSLREIEKFKRVFISNDRTKFQQSEWSKVRKEQVSRREAGEDVIIYSGKVVPRSSVQNFRK